MVARITKIFFHPIFIVALALYATIRILRSQDLNLPIWLNGYVTDLICIPVVLMICLALTRAIKQDSAITIKPMLILLICVEYALIFEWILPNQSSIYIGDWIDVLMYLAGGIIFYFIQPFFEMNKNITSS